MGVGWAWAWVGVIACRVERWKVEVLIRGNSMVVGGGMMSGNRMG